MVAAWRCVFIPCIIFFFFSNPKPIHQRDTFLAFAEKQRLLLRRKTTPKSKSHDHDMATVLGTIGLMFQLCSMGVNPGFAIYYIWNIDSGEDSENINAQDFVENWYLRFMARMSSLLYYVLQIGYNIFYGVFPGNIWPIIGFLCGVVSEGTLTSLVYKSNKKTTIGIICFLFILVAAPFIALFVYTRPSDAQSEDAKNIILAMSVVILAPSAVELGLLAKGMKYKAIAPVWYYVAGVVGNGCLFVNSLVINDPWWFPVRHGFATLLCGAVLIMLRNKFEALYKKIRDFIYNKLGYESVELLE